MSESNIQTELDLEFVRRQFPGLQNGWSFMDNAGGTQIVKGAVERMNDFLFNKNVQIGGSYEVSLAAAEALQAATAEAKAAQAKAAQAKARQNCPRK